MPQPARINAGCKRANPGLTTGIANNTALLKYTPFIFYIFQFCFQRSFSILDDKKSIANIYINLILINKTRTSSMGSAQLNAKTIQNKIK
jgi:hypothetical protein